ncbi:MAG: 16S rRNA (guanine(966)-N(2))-methyltransferase RsmD [Paludibacteraceae bacterium]|jgi:16S rRNA (guanine(966)-N(2))-methyltransferase RsmD|nr:16S rRNA (guanine(966)-N(2))-methyltransferase RsmD [Paludibacteraceae bacterium]
MRIISGTYKGRRISPPKNISARPTTDFAKESLFNLLNNRMDFEGIDMLDLFAGTGSIGLEFISRGARDVIAVEMAHTQQNFIIQTCKLLKIKNLNLIRGDVFKFINSCKMQFDFIYADPPYDLPQLSKIPDLIFKDNPSTNMTDSVDANSNHDHNTLLKPDGIFVLEHSKNNDFSTHPHYVETRKYGNVHFTFFE